MAGQQHHAFTVRTKGIARVILTRVGIRPASLTIPVSSGSVPEVEVWEAAALWDTGATNTVITTTTAAALGLHPISNVPVSHAGGVSTQPVYLVDLILPNNLMIFGLEVVGCEDTGSFDVLIGMDVINQGDFCVSTGGGSTTVSFRMPPGAITDFAKDTTAPPVRKGGSAYTPPKKKRK